MEEPAGVRCRVEQVVDLAGDEAFQASGGFSPGVFLSDLLLQIRLGAVVAAFRVVAMTCRARLACLSPRG